MDEVPKSDITTRVDGRPDPELVLTHLDTLPTLSAVALRLLQLTSNRNSSAQDVIEVLRGDQSLSAKILSVAGSAWTGASGPVNSLEKAIPLLGFSAVRSIVLAASVFECFPASEAAGKEVEFARREFWKHALAVACTARRLVLGRRDLGIEPHEAFIAGLLHDLGKVALSAVFPKSYDRVASQANQSRGDIADFERSYLGIDHTVAGRRIAERWHLPRELQEVAWLHHLAAETLPASVEAPVTIGLVQLADTISREQRIGYSGNYMFYEHSPRLAGRLGFDESHIDQAVEALVGDVAEYTELLGLDRESPDELYIEAMTRANAELSRLNTELTSNSRRLAASARYFRGLSTFDQHLSAWSDPPAVVVALTQAASLALQRPKVAAFGLRDNRAAVDICWISGEPGQGGARSQGLSAEMIGWLEDPGDSQAAVLTHAPVAVRAMLAPAVEELGRGTAWMVSIVHDRQIAGGIVYRSEGDERARLAGEFEDLRAFVASLGLALGRANAQAAARRLSDDLAETNRRLQQMQVELLRSRTLSMIAEMAAGAGHELNSPLTVISGRAQMLGKQSLDPEVRRSLEVISNKAHECSQIVSEMMDFARPLPPRLAAVDLAELLSKLRDKWLEELDLPANRVRLQIESAEFEKNGNTLQVRVDSNQIKAVFAELVANALDALTDDSGVINIRCQPAVSDNQVEILVHDTGCGMTPSVLQRAFDPFYSHRHAGRGRGLGLPRAYRIIESHGGRIWLESAPHEGTTAHVLLPCTPVVHNKDSQ
ncbi:MAG: HDOD domain-containing protein [Planctomycetota bacterium]